jgi:uncharacterized protein (TIGR00251 family)
MPSADSAPWYRWDGDRLIVSIRLQPRARRDEIAGPVGDHLKIRITAPPVDGKANADLVRFLAKTFNVASNRVYLLAGETSRRKRLAITRPSHLPVGIDPAKTN